MTETQITTLVSLFHTETNAEAAIADLRNAGIPITDIQTTRNGDAQSLESFRRLELPAEDLKMLSDGLQSGGTVITVRAPEAIAEQAEEIFNRHSVGKVDERIIDDGAYATAMGAANEEFVDSGSTIPVVEEELVVGKRAVRSGGVRVVSHVVDTPVAESITLRGEHAVVKRFPVDRAATETDFNAIHSQSIEVLSYDEEPVVSKSARVVEEVVVGKETKDRTETVSDTVRKTEVEVEKIGADSVSGSGVEQARFKD